MTTYSTMLNFTSDALANIFLEQYQFEIGEKKCIEIVRKVEDSEKVNQYIKNIINGDLKPSPKGLMILMNTISYFMFAKEETLCLGGLATFSLWKSHCGAIKNYFDDGNLEDARICADFIMECSKNKYNKSDNFFTRFFRKIDEIGRNEGL